MTREEAKPYIGELQMYAKSRGWDEEYLIACDVAMDALEQEPVIDKIQEEIKRVDTVCHASNNHDELIRRNVVLQILDKYKAESEDNNG